MDKKIYVKVEAEFIPDGALRPKCIIWDDGRRFEIDRVTDCRRAASLKKSSSITTLRATVITSRTITTYSPP